MISPLETVLVVRPPASAGIAQRFSALVQRTCRARRDTSEFGPTRDIGAFRGWGDPAGLPGYLYASPRYLALSGEPKEPGDMAQHECLCTPKVAAWMLDRGMKKVEVAVGGRLTLNSVGTASLFRLIERQARWLQHNRTLSTLVSEAETDLI